MTEFNKHDLTEYTCLEHFHRSFTYESKAAGKPLRVTYAVAGAAIPDRYSSRQRAADDNVPTVLYIGGMFCTRLAAYHFHRQMKRDGLRLVMIDRPGLGGSTSVPLAVRMQVWLETVEQLFKLLNIKHAALVSHSAGTMYCLNTLLYMPQLLSPTRPYVAMLAPWVHPAHSNKALMTVASQLPTPVFGAWNTIVKAISGTIAPAVQSSISFSSPLTSTASSKEARIRDALPRTEALAMSLQDAERLDEIHGLYFRTEDSTGGNEEAKLCLKKGPPGTWAVADDYEAYVACLVEALKKKEDGAPQLTMHVFHAASDALVGTGGREYFNACWSEEKVQGVIGYEAWTCEGTDHDSVTNAWGWAMDKIMQMVKENEP